VIKFSPTMFHKRRVKSTTFVTWHARKWSLWSSLRPYITWIHDHIHSPPTQLELQKKCKNCSTKLGFLFMIMVHTPTTSHALLNLYHDMCHIPPFMLCLLTKKSTTFHFMPCFLFHKYCALPHTVFQILTILDHLYQGPPWTCVQTCSTNKVWFMMWKMWKSQLINTGKLFILMWKITFLIYFQTQIMFNEL